jgi:methylated-DNA-protein-cysteine methyltransferase-like protein
MPPARASFFAQVWALVRRVPRGRVVTYGQVAALLGTPRAARAVGWALRALPSARDRDVPWHRVLGSSGRISLRDGAGPSEQRQRLQAEGVRFVGERVDLARHLWRAPVQRSGSTARRQRSGHRPDHEGSGRPRSSQAQRRS